MVRNTTNLKNEKTQQWSKNTTMVRNTKNLNNKKHNNGKKTNNGQKHKFHKICFGKWLQPTQIPGYL